MTAEVIIFNRDHVVELPCDVEPLTDARLYGLLAPTVLHTLRELVEHSEHCTREEARLIFEQAELLLYDVRRRR